MARAAEAVRRRVRRRCIQKFWLEPVSQTRLSWRCSVFSKKEN
jgi:hypothetical protein